MRLLVLGFGGSGGVGGVIGSLMPCCRLNPIFGQIPMTSLPTCWRAPLDAGDALIDSAQTASETVV